MTVLRQHIGEGLWWRPLGVGYTDQLHAAGLYVSVREYASGESTHSREVDAITTIRARLDELDEERDALVALLFACEPTP